MLVFPWKPNKTNQVSLSFSVNVLTSNCSLVGSGENSERWSTAPRILYSTMEPFKHLKGPHQQEGHRGNDC